MEKFGAIRTPLRGSATQEVAQPLQPALVEAGRTDDRVHAVLDAPGEVVHHHVGVGEVDRDRRTRVHQQLRVVSVVDLGDQVEIVGRLDRLAHRRADLAPRAEHAHRDPLSHGSHPRPRLRTLVDASVVQVVR